MPPLTLQNMESGDWIPIFSGFNGSRLHHLFSSIVDHVNKLITCPKCFILHTFVAKFGNVDVTPFGEKFLP